MRTLRLVVAEKCANCRKALEAESRSQWCGSTCKNRDWNDDKVEQDFLLMNLPEVTIPAEILQQIDTQLPIESEHLVTAYGFLLRSQAPAIARGYRVGTLRKKGQRLRWFPASGNLSQAAFRLDPFELPSVPFRGRYVVVFTDEMGEPIGEPSFVIEIGFREVNLCFSDGDRSMRPRRRRRRKAATRAAQAAL